MKKILFLALMMIYACNLQTSKVIKNDGVLQKDILSKKSERGLSFFITSRGVGNGANLGGLSGADQHCKSLASDVGEGNKKWRAYLSSSATKTEPAVNARDRIGIGPWYNAKNIQIAQDVTELHSDQNKLSKDLSLTEKGTIVNGRGDEPNEHDILTGSQVNGTAFDDDKDHTCENWTSSSEGSAQVGHHDRIGGGSRPTSWNSSHGSRGCSQSNLQGTGGNGYFYCFASNRKLD